MQIKSNKIMELKLEAEYFEVGLSYGAIYGVTLNWTPTASPSRKPKDILWG